MSDRLIAAVEPVGAVSRQGVLVVEEELQKLFRGVTVVVLAYLLLAALYAWVTPVFEKPDEPWHFAFAMYLAEEGRLPVQSLEGRDHLAEQEGSQPPLYYALLAGLIKVGGLDGLEPGYLELTEENPFYGGKPGAWLENAAQYVHDPCNGLCQRTIQAVYLGRGLSVFFGVVALLAAAAALFLAFPRQPYWAIGVVGLIAFNPQFLHISSSVSNDAATVAMVNVGFAVALWWLRCPASTSRAIILGVVAGLAALAKPSGLSVGVIAGTLLVVGGTLSTATRVRTLALYGAAFLSVCGWWFLRNWRLYGEPTATRIHLQVYGEPAPEFTVSRFLAEWKSVLNTFWASFGWGAINLGDGLYELVSGLTLLLMVAFVLLVQRRWREWNQPQRALVALSVLQLLLVGGLLFRWMRLTVAPLGRLLFPALLPVAVILLGGLLYLAPKRFREQVVYLYIAGWAVAALVLPVALIRPAYAALPPLAALPHDAVPLGTLYGDAIILEGYSVPQTPVAPGSEVPVTLYWRALRPLDEQLVVGVKVFGRDGELLAQDNSYPDAGRSPTGGWRSGEIVTDRKSLVLSPEARTPTLGRVAVDLFRLENLQRLPVRVDGQVVEEYRPFSLLVRGEDTIHPEPDRGYTVRPRVSDLAMRDGAVTFDVVWEVGQALEAEYQAFLHLAPALDQPPVEQDDFTPLGGDFPTSFWRAGDALVDTASLQLPREAPKGDYYLLLGLYDLQDGTRVVGEAGQDTWVVATLQRDGEGWRITSP